MGRVFHAEVMIKHWYDALERTTKENTMDVLIDAAEQIRDLAMLIAPRETGALRNSIAIVSQQKSDYSAMVANARRFRRNAKIQKKPSAGKNEVYIVPVVGYAGFVEFGARGGGQAQPFLIPALRTVGMSVLPKGFAAQVFGRYRSRPPIVRTMVF